jgi:hypothetical protein
MTISTESNTITYDGNGSTTIWSFSFPAGPDPDIQVFTRAGSGLKVLVTSNVQINVNPSIDPNPTSVGGTVVYPVTGAPLAVGNQLIITRQVPLIQPTSFANQSIFYPKVVEAAFDYVVMQIQQLLDKINQTFIEIPPCPQRANKFLAFDENCNPVAIGNSNPIMSSNGIRVPNTEVVPELPVRELRTGTVISFDNNGDPILLGFVPSNVPPLFGARVTYTAVHTVANTEKSNLLQLAGNTFYDLIFTAPTNYDADFSVAVFNADVYTGPGSGRAKRIMFNGTIMPGGLLWPGQWVYIFRFGSTWVANPRDVRWKPGIGVTFFVDQVLGHDDGTSDGLATGTGAVKTIGAGVNAALARVDYGGVLAVNGATVQLAPGTYTEVVTIKNSTVGGIPLTLRGAADGVDPTPWLFRTTTTSNGLTVSDGTSVIITGINFNGQGTNRFGIVITGSSSASIINCRFGAFPGINSEAVTAYDGSTVHLRTIRVSGNIGWPFVASRSSTMMFSGVLTVSNNLTFTAFVYADFGSQILGGPNVVGDPTDYSLVGGAGCAGYQYYLVFNSIGTLGPEVSTGLANIDFLPGNLGPIVGSTGVFGFDSSMSF